MGQMRHIKKYYADKAKKNRPRFSTKQLLTREPWIRFLIIIWLIFVWSFVTASMQSCVTLESPAVMPRQSNQRDYIGKFYRDAERRRRYNKHHHHDNHQDDY